jgi:hypothetical protein
MPTPREGIDFPEALANVDRRTAERAEAKAPPNVKAANKLHRELDTAKALVERIAAVEWVECDATLTLAVCSLVGKANALLRRVANSVKRLDTIEPPVQAPGMADWIDRSIDGS